MTSRSENKMSNRARRWLPLQFDNGPRRARELYSDAQKIGISPQILSIIMRELNIQTTRRKDGWYWSKETA